MPRRESGGGGADEYLTPQEAADVLKVTPLTIRRWLKAGTLKASKIGRLWRIKRSDLEKALSGSGAPSAQPKNRGG